MDMAVTSSTGKGWAAFQSREFVWYFGSRFLSSLAAMMVDVGVGWLIYDITNSALALGLAGLVAFMPNIVLMLLVGHVADRFDRKRVLIICYSVTVLASAGLVACAAVPNIDVRLVYALILLFGTARAFSNPASQALLPTIVPKHAFANALAWNSSAWQTAAITGPAMGGIAYAFGAPVVFGTTTVLYLGCLLMLFQIQHRHAASANQRVNWETLTAGFRFIWSRPAILGAISLDLFAVLLGGATALLPIYARDIFHVGPLGLGVLRCMPAVGAFLCTMVLAQTNIGGRAGIKMFIAVAIYGVATIGFGLSTSFWMAMPFLALLGSADMVSVLIRQTLVQLDTPDEMRGRVSAVNTIFIGASNELGEFESGALASFIGPVRAVVIGGIGAIVIAGLWARWFPALLRRDRLET
jgi:MFS family permease